MPRPRTSPQKADRPHPYYSDRFSQDWRFYRVKRPGKAALKAFRQPQTGERQPRQAGRQGKALAGCLQTRQGRQACRKGRSKEGAFALSEGLDG